GSLYTHGKALVDTLHGHEADQQVNLLLAFGGAVLDLLRYSVQGAVWTSIDPQGKRIYVWQLLRLWRACRGVCLDADTDDLLFDFLGHVITTYRKCFL